MTSSTKRGTADKFRLVVDGLIYSLQAFGGLTTYWDQLLGGLSERGVSVELVLPSTPLRTSGLAGDRQGPQAPEVFHSTYFTMPPTSVAASVVTVHDTIYEDSPEMAGALDPCLQIVERKRRCISAADSIVTPSQATAQRLRLHYPALSCPVHIVPHGADHLDRSSGHPQSVRPGTLPSARPFLMHVGGRRFYKNFLLLLTAFAYHGLSEEFDLLVVGSEPRPLPEEADALEVVSRQACVRFLGYVAPAELASLYQRAAAVVSASRSEGFGLPLVEAAAAGAPVACSQIPAYLENLTGVASFFDSDEPSDCSAAVARAVAQRAHASAAAGPIRSRFTWARTVDQMIAVYREAVAVA